MRAPLSIVSLIVLASLALAGLVWFFWPSLGPISLRAISTRPELVSGGDLLVDVATHRGTRPKELKFYADETELEFDARWTPSQGSEQLIAIIRGLPLGTHTLRVERDGFWPWTDAISEGVIITNYPASGPMISGPHETPYVCETEKFRLVNGERLGAPLDKDCAVATRVDYVYLNTQGEFLPYPEKGKPTDIKTTALIDGTARPMIVRVETGTVNRAVYEIAMLHNPEQPTPSPWVQSPGWNHKLIYTHGGGCRRGWYRQGSQTGGVLRETLLERGYAIASASLNVFGNNCNDLLASETHIMVKERFIERYGEPMWTIGTGGSGGAYQCQQTADNYPGIFDGILISLSFPDVLSSTIFTLADARLLHNYFTTLAPDGMFDEAAVLAITGFARAQSLPSLSQGAARIDPLPRDEAPWTLRGAEFDTDVDEALRFPRSPDSNAKATVYDHMVNIFGRDPQTQMAGRPLDNEGIQYGLDALKNGAISIDQFLHLNENIGGFDALGNIVPMRHVADEYATQMALATGRILRAKGGLLTTPTINMRRYTDERTFGDVHMFVHQFSTRARLRRAGSDLSQYHMIVRDDAPSLTPEQREKLSPVEREAKINDRYREVYIPLFMGLDEWLTAIHLDKEATDLPSKIRRHRPQSLVDGCWIQDESGEHFVSDSFSAPSSPCTKSYPIYSTPRMVAGAPLENDIVKCQRKNPVREDYPKAMSASQWQRLLKIFPTGVCDFSKPDQFDTPYAGPWTSVGPSPIRRIGRSDSGVVSPPQAEATSP